MAIIDVFVFAAGFAACWYGKDMLTKWFVGAEAFAASAKAKADAALSAVKK